MARNDNIAECNNLRVGEKDFCAVWCVRCLNSECSRALAGKGKFDQRVRTWEDRYFKNPATMPESDPRFGIVSAKLFTEVPAGSVPEVRGWDVDPESVVAPSVVQEPDPEPLIVLHQNDPSTGVKAIEPLPRQSPGVMLGNTPAMRGQMLSGSSKDVIVAPGGRIRLKGNPSGV